MAATHTTPVDPGNEEQLRAWDGDEGAYWAAHADLFDRSIAEHHEPFLEAAGIVDGTQVLDVGCGTGQTTRDAARRAGSGAALGVDLSSAMLAHARRRAAEEGVANARFEQVDAQIHPFEPAAFDVAISRTGAMFFADPVAAFRNIGAGLRPGGRLVLLTWQPLAANEWIREIGGALAAGRHESPAPPEGRGPFSLSEPHRVREVLDAAGYRDVELAASEAGMWFGSEADDAQQFTVGLLGWMLEGLDQHARGKSLDALRATMEAHESAGGVVFGSAAWTIRAAWP